MRSLVKYADEVPTGLQPDRGVEKQDLWEDGENVIFQEGAVQPAPGQYLLVPRPEGSPIRGIVEARFSDGTRNVFFGTLTKLWHFQEKTYSAADDVSSGAYTLVEDANYDPDGGGVGVPEWYPASQWSMVSWGNTIFATSGVDEIQVFDYTGAGVGLTNFTLMNAHSDLAAAYRADILGKIGPFLIVFGRLDDGAGNYDPFTIQWCDEDDTTTWTAAVDNAAGELEARDLGSPIICAQPFASGYAVYGNFECRFFEFVGAPDYFGLRPLLSGIGALSKNAVVSVERLQFGMGNRGIWMHDGSQAKYIDTPDIHDYIYSDINQNQVTKCTVGYDSIEQLVLFFWPSSLSNELDKGVAYNRRNKTWTKLGYARTSYAAGHVWEGGLTGDVEGNVYLHSGIGFAPTGTGSPLALDAIAYLRLSGYGKNGYGMGYYGGEIIAFEG